MKNVFHITTRGQLVFPSDTHLIDGKSIKAKHRYTVFSEVEDGKINIFSKYFDAECGPMGVDSEVTLKQTCGLTPEEVNEMAEVLKFTAQIISSVAINTELNITKVS